MGWHADECLEAIQSFNLMAIWA